MLTEDFDYELPVGLIAQVPVDPRDSARLLDSRDVSDHSFSDLPDLLRTGDLLVVNRTRVRPARLIGKKAGTGGEVEVLLLKRVGGEAWEALVRPARRLHKGVEIGFGGIRGTLLEDPVGGRAIVSLETEGDIEESLRRWGQVPLPPYIHGALADPDRYQTLWADLPGSVAAPTAGLHFTSALVDRLSAAGVSLASVDLEVGLATFRPISVARVEDHEMHSEVFRVDATVVSAIDRTRERGGRVIAVGTTSVRALESAAVGGGRIKAVNGETDLFLRPGVEFSVVDALITNFHMPRSSLIVMLAGFMGPVWRGVYEAAIERRYRFLSFGDAMFCERA